MIAEHLCSTREYRGNATAMMVTVLVAAAAVLAVWRRVGVFDSVFF